MEMERGLKEILDDRNNQLKELHDATTLIKSKDSLKSDLDGMKLAVTGLLNLVQADKKNLEIMKKQNERCQAMLTTLKNLDEKILDLEANVPTQLIQDYQLVLSSTKPKSLRNRNNFDLQPNVSIFAANEISYEVSHLDKTLLKDCKKILFNDPVYLIRNLTPEEFSNIPKYIIGRQSLESLNDFIKVVNSILTTKYMILSMGQGYAKEKNKLGLYWKYTKEQAIVEKLNGPSYFFGTEDYEKHTSLKLDKIKLNFLVALRHSKRIHNFRNDKNTYYIVSLSQ